MLEHVHSRCVKVDQTNSNKGNERCRSVSIPRKGTERDDTAVINIVALYLCYTEPCYLVGFLLHFIPPVTSLGKGFQELQLWIPYYHRPNLFAGPTLNSIAIYPSFLCLSPVLF